MVSNKKYKELQDKNKSLETHNSNLNNALACIAKEHNKALRDNYAKELLCFEYYEQKKKNLEEIEELKEEIEQLKKENLELLSRNIELTKISPSLFPYEYLDNPLYVSKMTPIKIGDELL